ncbi:MAG TPA: hypothetical protein VEU96_33080 [Bryobacteraceae bacterium]|nr:hypothetical protein [Bryobacteraceae bacterium]
MGRINWPRVILGGILAALIINVAEYLINAVVLAKDWSANLANLHLPPDIGMNAVVIFNITGLVVGVITVWLYAAIRSRYGAGVKTALIAAIAIWLLAYAMPTLGYIGLGVVPQQIGMIAIGLALVEIVIASIAGAWVYTEGVA